MIATRRTTLVVAAIVAVALVGGYTVGTAAAANNAANNQVALSNFDDDIAAAEKKQAEQEAALDRVEKDLQHTEAAIVEANRKVTELEQQLPGVQAAYDEAQETLDQALLQQEIVADKLAAAEAQDRAITEEIAKDEERIAELRITVAALARDTYRGTGTQDNLGVVFGSTTSQEFVDEFAFQHSAARAQSAALGELEQVASVNRNRAARQESVREYIEELKIIADELVVEADAARVVAEEKKREVEALLDELRELRSFLEQKRAEEIARQRELEAEQQKIEDELRELIRKKIEAEGPPNPTPIGAGALAFPTAVPHITSSYGYRIHPIYGYRLLHQGTDFRAWCGTPIYASASGTVQRAQWQGGFGNFVLLDHGWVNGNALATGYAHLTSFAVSSGQSVRRGDVIGYSGTTGNSTACHLHFETYVNGSTVNPMTLLGPIP